MRERLSNVLILIDQNLKSNLILLESIRLKLMLSKLVNSEFSKIIA